MMKADLFCLVVCLGSSLAAVPVTDATRLVFTNWARAHGKTYKTAEEANRRLSIFAENLQKIDSHNALAAQGKSTYTLGATKWADLTNAEYRERVLGGYRSRGARAVNATTYVPKPVKDLPDTVDWRDKGVVTGVKDQGQCGSCWSFSATGSMEGAHALSTGNLVSLSEQNLIDCVQGGSYTCDTGGEMQDAFAWVIQNGGIESEDEYPYCTCSGNQCAFDQSQVVATFSNYQAVTQGDENALQSAAANQPGVSVAIDASNESFQLYSGGVYNEPACSSTQLDHGVLVIGYGNYDGSDYWLVKNSWGDSWGLQGYIMMSRNLDNQCGIATDASFPLV
jgi:cathepsin L